METILTSLLVQAAIIVLAICMYSSMGGPAGPYVAFTVFCTAVNLLAFKAMREDFDK